MSADRDQLDQMRGEPLWSRTREESTRTVEADMLWTSLRRILWEASTCE